MSFTNKLSINKSTSLNFPTQTHPHQQQHNIQQKSHFIKSNIKNYNKYISSLIMTSAMEEDYTFNDSPQSQDSTLVATIKRKQRELGVHLDDLGIEGLVERLQNSVEIPIVHPHRFVETLKELAIQGRQGIICDLSTNSVPIIFNDLIEYAQQCVSSGADALSIRLDSKDSPNGIRDLFTICRSVNVPIFAKDWFLHPLQIIEAKEAGASGLFGIIASVNSRGTPMLNGFSSAMGLDAPVEIVNLRELEFMKSRNVKLYCINVNVSLKVPISGFASDVTEGLLKELPFGALSIVGVKSFSETIIAKQAGADAIFVREEFLKENSGNLKGFLNKLKYDIIDNDA